MNDFGVARAVWARCKTFGTGLTLATLAFGIGDAQAHTSPKAHTPSTTSVRHACGFGDRAGPRCPAAASHLSAPSTSAPAAPVQLAPSNTTAYSTIVSWPAVNGVTSTRVYVNGLLLDQFAAGPVDRYEIQGLWPATSFVVVVELDSVNGNPPIRYTATIITRPRTIAFRRLYAATAFINTPIGQDPSIAPDSAAIVSQAITRYSSVASLANSSDWGIPIVYASALSSSYNVGCQQYWCSAKFESVRIPTSAEPDTGSDGHLVVLQADGDEMDMWRGQRVRSGWTSGARWLESAGGPATDCTTQPACGGADAADFALGAGVARPEELAQGQIDHALAITTPDTRLGYIACPAAHGDGTHADPNALPLGAHLQLNPAINVNSLRIPTWQKVIAVALQTYGAYVVDTGGSLEIRGQSNLGRSYDAWADAGISENAPSLSDLPWSSMRVLKMTQCGS